MELNIYAVFDEERSWVARYAAESPEHAAELAATMDDVDSGDIELSDWDGRFEPSHVGKVVLRVPFNRWFVIEPNGREHDYGSANR